MACIIRKDIRNDLRRNLRNNLRNYLPHVAKAPRALEHGARTSVRSVKILTKVFLKLFGNDERHNEDNIRYKCLRCKVFDKVTFFFSF